MWHKKVERWLNRAPLSWLLVMLVIVAAIFGLILLVEWLFFPPRLR
jgi:hypothetical protein